MRISHLVRFVRAAKKHPAHDRQSTTKAKVFTVRAREKYRALERCETMNRGIHFMGKEVR